MISFQEIERRNFFYHGRLFPAALRSTPKKDSRQEQGMTRFRSYFFATMSPSPNTMLFLSFFQVN